MTTGNPSFKTKIFLLCKSQIVDGGPLPPGHTSLLFFISNQYCHNCDKFLKEKKRVKHNTSSVKPIDAKSINTVLKICKKANEAYKTKWF